MLKTIFGAKNRMGATFVQGTRVPVTYIQAGPCVVTQIKLREKDGYDAVQLGFMKKKEKNITKPLQGHLKKVISDKKAPRYLREVKEKGEFNVGDVVSASDVLKVGDLVTITGTSKGKGFAGNVKRHHFRGGPKTHGQSDRHRAPGSIGQGTTPGRVLKNKRMAGRMGSDTKTVKNLIVVSVNKETGLIGVSGPVPGSDNSLLTIRKTGSGKLAELVEETPVAVVQEEVVEEEPKTETVEGGENK